MSKAAVSSRGYLVGPIWVVVATVAIAWVISAEDLLLTSMPTGGDLAGHVWWPQALREQVLSSGRLSGWTMDQLAGFPLGRYYHPLPALIILLLDILLPYTVAVRLAVVAGALATPLAAYRLGRALDLEPGGAVMVSAGGVMSLFIAVPAPVVLGGNLESLVAGEFAWLAAVPLSLLALARSFRTNGDPDVKLALLLAATVLSHVVVGAVTSIWVVGAVLAKRRPVPGDLVTWLVAASLTAAWTLPLITSLGLTADPGFWRPTSRLEALVDPWWALVAVVAVGVLAGRGFTAERTVAWWMGSAGGLVLAWPDGNALSAGRLLPFWVLSLLLGTGLVLARIIRRLGNEQTGAWSALAIATVVLVVGLTSTAEVRERADIAMGGLEQTPGWSDIEPAVAAIRALPSGRAMWEDHPSLRETGSVFAFLLLPYWTDGRITTLDGLYRESTPTSFFIERTRSEISVQARRTMAQIQYASLDDFDLGVTHMQLLGVRYYLARSDAAQRLAGSHPELDAIFHDRGGWAIYEVADSAIVSPLGGYRSAEPDELGNPDAWFYRKESSGTIPVDKALPVSPGGPVMVSDVEVSPDNLRFRVDHVGSPVLIRVSWFPNWVAQGAEGPFRAGPNLMAVIPTDNEVELTFTRDTTEVAGMTITILAGGAVVLGSVFRRTHS